MEAGHRSKALACTSSASGTTGGLSSLLVLLLSNCVLLWLSLFLLLHVADSFDQQQHLQQQQRLLYLESTAANIAPKLSFRCFVYNAHAAAAAGKIAGRRNALRKQTARCLVAKTPRIGSVAGDQSRSMMSSGARLGDGLQHQHHHQQQQRWEELTLVRPMETVRLPLGRGLRVHCLSDLHTDYKANIAWVKTCPTWKGDQTELGRGHEDVLLVAGDVSSSLPRLIETLSDLMDRYDQVCFVVGNHDLWIQALPRPPEGEEGKEGEEARKPEEAGEVDGGSVEKLVQIHRECEILGVRVNPVTFVLGGKATGGEEEVGEGTATTEVCLFPLLSWYHASWDDEPDLPPEDQYRNGDFLRRWGDYRKCRWPEQLCSREDFVTVSRDSPTPLADFFSRQNDACIEAFLASRGRGVRGGSSRTSSPSAGGVKSGATLITFSHFVPRQELCPEKRFLSEPMLTKAIGSAPLERQIRRLGSDVHVYGHTHIPYDFEVEGVRYIQWPLGSTAEQSRQCRRMHEEGPLLVYSHDGWTGGLSPEEPTFWGDYYREQPRDVRETSVPEWALKRMRGRRKTRPPTKTDETDPSSVETNKHERH